MITNKQFLEECPGWSYQIDILRERLYSLLPTEITVDNLIDVSVVRDKQHYTDYGIKLNIPNELISSITNSVSHLNLHLKLEDEFEKTALTINDYCCHCGQKKSKKYITPNSKNENVARSISKSKDYFRITFDFRGFENCDFCTELNSEEKRLLNCSLSKILGNKSLINKYALHVDTEEYNSLLNEYLENSQINYSDWSYLHQVKKPPVETRIDLNKTVRYIDDNQTFNYSECGKYIFYKSEFYVYLGNTCIQESELNLSLKSNLKKFKKVIFAGHDTGVKDDFGQRIFTGDVIEMNSNHRRSRRNPNTCFKKEREFTDTSNLDIKCSGAVISIFNPECYGMSFDHGNVAVFLCQANNIEIIGNVFFNLIPQKKINLQELALFYSHSAPNETENHRGFLKNFKTPSFKNSRAIQSLINFFNLSSKK